MTVLALFIAIIQAWRHKTIKPMILWGGAFLLLYLIVGVPKIYLRRGAPADLQVDAVELFSKPFCGGAACMSYPSGHAANSIVWYGLGALLLGTLLHSHAYFLVRVLVASIVAVATVISGFHWATDTLAGVLAGAAIYLLLRQLDNYLSGYQLPLDPRRLWPIRRLRDSGA
ncbi:branched-subunit amino acid transport protein [Plantactinospora soyae]|uniref:Branched-subunit amino acid transport protein n=1 Tax=Plantactinospora soyae TaxID=1544732 RepID=A0A927R601_9ACTN|nr:branched-subunit amino acid transport protein [Plantactinospora soyae]